MPTPEVQNLQLDGTVDERKTAAMERQAEAAANMAAATAALAGTDAPYSRPAFFASMLRCVVGAGRVRSINEALAWARELTDGYEVEFPDYVSPPNQP